MKTKISWPGIAIARSSLAVLAYGDPAKSAVHGFTQILPCGGKIPITEDWCNMVDIRDACTDTKLPPIPLITGWNASEPSKVSIILSRTNPPPPLIKRADRIGTQPDFNTFLVYLFFSTITIQIGISTMNNAKTMYSTHTSLSSLLKNSEAMVERMLIDTTSPILAARGVARLSGFILYR